MAISRRDVEHIAQLARIMLSEEEKSLFEKELSAILEFVAALTRLDTRVVAPMTGGISAQNIMRHDEKRDDGLHDAPAELVDAAPEKREGWITIKRIF